MEASLLTKIPKLVLHLPLQNFKIYGHLDCIVIITRVLHVFLYGSIQKTSHTNN